ncbi:MAG: NAD(P)-binding domain-containing protein, partial [Streptosporangiaceae bacterium]
GRARRDRVAVLGLGEAGAAYARGLAAAGVPVAGWDPARGKVIEGALEGALEGVEPAPGPAEAVREASVVLSLNSGSVAEQAARAAAPGLRKGTLFADLNTAAPATKVAVAGVVERRAATFADVALLAPVPRAGVATPALVSGDGAEEYARRLRGLGAPVEVVEGGPGAAATRRLLRSVFMKGLAAVVLESLWAAAAVGSEPWVRAQIVDELERADASLVDRLVEGSSRHAVRRVDEVRAAMGLLAGVGVPARTTGAALEWLTDLAGEGLAGKTPTTDDAPGLSGDG